MKKLYEFTSPKEEQVDETAVSKNGAGEEVKTVTKVQKKVAKKFFIRKPTRAMYDEAELFYDVKLSEAIKGGVLTRAQLSTKFSNEGDTLSQSEKERYAEVFMKLSDKEKEYQILSLKKESEQTDDEKQKSNDVLNEVIQCRRDLQEVEQRQNSLYDHTAENRARNKTILWWAFILAYNENEKFFFGEGGFKEKLAQYDLFEEKDDEFSLGVANKFLYFTSFWYMGKADKQEDFEKLAEIIGLSEKQEVVKEEAKASEKEVNMKPVLETIDTIKAVAKAQEELTKV